MSDYNLQIAWSGKDALSDSDPDKVVSGGDFNTEFLAVKTAVNSKADLANTSQVVTAATATAGTNTNQVATTAFVTAAMTAATINNLVYPVGSVYVNATVATNPATLLGVGTWVAYGEGRVPVGKASSGTFDTLGATGGAETQALTEANLPSHNHNSVHGGSSGSGRPSGFSAVSNSSSPYNFGGGTDDDDWGISTTSSTGSGTAHNNLQPYIVVYMWKRTA
jgi:microcystin-dependent protein